MRRSTIVRFSLGYTGLGLLLSAAFAYSQPLTANREPDKVLRGTVVASQNNSYIEVPFELPAGTERLSFSFTFTGKEQRTTLDLGLIDPNGLRCWSGGNKDFLTLSETEATPSCLAGRLPTGTWKLLIGVPNLRSSQTSKFTAKLYFNRNGRVVDEPLPLSAAIRSGPGWYRGDLHLHTAHSDGSCASESGRKVPCPVYLTLDAARRRGLDFIAITDHNTTSQYDAMRELAPYFDQLLLIPGREITTFRGHANVFGIEDPLDFRLGSANVPDVNTLLKRAQALGALVSLNHPGAPTAEFCMGCGWTPNPAADMSLVQAVEAINSGAEEGPYSGTPFWQRELNLGYRLTAVGGSDNHDATMPLDKVGSVGSPTTVVHAAALSVALVLEAIRAGHVFVDLTASKDKLLELHAAAGLSHAEMGDTIHASQGDTLHLVAHVVRSQAASLIWIKDGQSLKGKDSPVNQDDQTFNQDWQSDGKQHWFRVDVRGADGKLWLLGNPVYVNWHEMQH